MFFGSGRDFSQPLLLSHQFKQSKFMVRSSPALPIFPEWDSSIANDVIASCSPIIASDVIATGLLEQPEAPEVSVQPGQPEDTMASATAPVDINVIRVVLILRFDKSAALHSIETITNHGAK